MGMTYHALKKLKHGKSPGVLRGYTPDNIKRICWCMDNSISIAVVPNWNASPEWMVELKINGGVNTDPINYSGEDALRKMYEYYDYYYYKYNTNEN